MLAVAALTLAAVGIGIGCARRWTGAVPLVERMLSLSLWVVLPIVVFFSFARFDFTAELGVGIAFAYVGLAAALGLAYLLARGPLQLHGSTRGAFLCASFAANTGFLGLPFTVALLGYDELPAAITYDLLVSAPWLLVVAFAIGAAYRREEESAERGVRQFFLRNPALYAMMIGLAAPDFLAPDWAVDASRLLVLAMAPIGFFALGVFGAGGAEAQRLPPRLTKPVAVASLLKLAVPVSALLACSLLIHDVPDAYLLQAAMPTGLNTLLLVSAYKLDRALIVGAIFYTTTLVLAGGIAGAVW
jgi:predicted permease